MRRTIVWSSILTALTLSANLAWSISFTSFGAHGEGGRINAQDLRIGPGGSVYELDAFVHIQGFDLNGATAGESACLSRDSLPTGLTYRFSSQLQDDNRQLRLLSRICG